MPTRRYKALVVSQTEQGRFERQVDYLPVADLPNHDVLVRVHYSSLNYKDALSATGHKGVTEAYPHTPGIDAAGIIEHSDDRRFREGDHVIVTSFGLGEDTPGGFGEYIRVPGDWVVPLPAGLTLRESMILGSAGFTAGYAIHKLQLNDTFPEDGPILVTGATGGVGSVAVASLSEAGYRVAAATGKVERSDFLKLLGARKIIHRDTLNQSHNKALLRGQWAGAVDTVGGSILDTIIRQTRHDGTVTCCGNILGGELHTSIYPFILRGISLMGIDSGRCLMPTRKKIWDLLADRWKPASLNRIAHEVSLDELDGEIKKILRGGQTGRTVVNLNMLKS